MSHGRNLSKSVLMSSHIDAFLTVFACVQLVATSKSVATSNHIETSQTVGHIESHGRFLLRVKPSDHLGPHGRKFGFKCVHSNDNIGMDGSLSIRVSNLVTTSGHVDASLTMCAQGKCVHSRQGIASRGKSKKRPWHGIYVFSVIES